MLLLSILSQKRAASISIAYAILNLIMANVIYIYALFNLLLFYLNFVAIFIQTRKAITNPVVFGIPKRILSVIPK